MAAHTTLPIIGVPINSSPLNGMDALLSTVQMPPGIPVATVAVGIGGAKNAAVLAAQILALKYPPIAKKLKDYRKELTQKAIEKADTLSKK
jgi:phosphoribosylaminoimidazole carboxylase PurE protein